MQIFTERSNAPLHYSSPVPWKRKAYIIPTEDLVLKYQDVLGPLERSGTGRSHIMRTMMDVGIRFAANPMQIPVEFEQGLIFTPALEALCGIPRARIEGMVTEFVARVATYTKIRHEQYSSIDDLQMTAGHDMMLALIIKV